MNQPYDTPFDEVEAPGNASLEIFAPTETRDLSPLVGAEINQQIATAHRYPRRRDIDISNEIMSRACLNEDTAAECVYSLPRAGKNLMGESIRFAEIVMVSYGNLRVASRFVEIDIRDPKRPAVLVEGVCMDLQANVGQVITVRRSIMTKRGIMNADMINVTIMAAQAIARRDVTLKTVPKTIWGGAYKRSVSVLQGDAETLVARRSKVLEAFGRRKVTEAMVLDALELKGVEDVTVEHMPRLFGMLTALADGTETVASMFDKPGPVEKERRNPLQDDDAPGDDLARQTVRGQGTPSNSAVSGKTPAGATVSDGGRPPETAQGSLKRDEGTQGSPKGSKSTHGAPPANPMTPEEYLGHFHAWVQSVKSEAGGRDQWAAERKLRSECAVDSGSIGEMKAALDKHIQGLK